MNYLKEFLELQNELNIQINGEGWESKNIDWYTALVGECCELIKEVRGDHWRDLNKDTDNKAVIGELADIAHFLVARASSSGLSLKTIENRLTDSKPINNMRDVVKTIHGIHQQEAGAFDYFNHTMSLLNLDSTMVLKHTLAKCVLNKFRQDHGYKEGTYRKVWDGVKDSEVVFNIVETFEGDFNCTLLYEILMEDYEFMN